jgi:D-serine deaminase-like pyridoxal phosphate-dependent protein
MIDRIDTPALLVDGERLRRNVTAMADRARAAGARLRPHAKTHKCAEVAELQRAAGAHGVTVATVAEAERFVTAGFDDVLLAHPPVPGRRLDRFVALAARGRLSVAVDDAQTLLAIDAACASACVSPGVLWELDCGLARCGTLPGAATAAAARPAVDELRACRFEGFMTFPGHAYRARGPSEIRTIAVEEAAALRQTAAEFDVDAPILSAGSTPTAHFADAADGITELRPGNYVFYDATQVALGVTTVEDCAVSVLATVVSRPAANRVIVDAGSKALAAERMSELTRGFGIVVDHPELTVERLFEEHGILITDQSTDVRVGDRLRIIPNHSCAAVNLHDRMLVVDAEDVLDMWQVAPRAWREGNAFSSPSQSALWR